MYKNVHQAPCPCSPVRCPHARRSPPPPPWRLDPRGRRHPRRRVRDCLQVRTQASTQVDASLNRLDEFPVQVIANLLPNFVVRNQPVAGFQ